MAFVLKRTISPELSEDIISSAFALSKDMHPKAAVNATISKQTEPV